LLGVLVPGWVGFDLWVSSYYVLLRIASQPSMKGNGGFYDEFCLCGGIGRDDYFGGGFSSGTDLVR
jgi:hypothetical protein